MYDQRARDKQTIAVKVRHQSMIPVLELQSSRSLSHPSNSGVDARSVLRNVPVAIGLTSQPLERRCRLSQLSVRKF